VSSAWQTDPNYTDTNAEPDTLYTCTVIMRDAAGNQTAASAPATVQTPKAPTPNLLPAPWQQEGVGGAAARGWVLYEDGVFTVHGSGCGTGFTTWKSLDEFYFVHRTATSDCEIVARVAEVSSTHPWTKAGVMIRQSLHASSPFAMVVITPDNGVSFHWRTTQGTWAEGYTPFPASGNVADPKRQTAPLWLKLVRKVDQFTAYTSDDGAIWTQLGATQTISMPAGTITGLCLDSRIDGVYAQAVFEQVSLHNPSASPQRLAK
jgi:hypothetical protein